MIEWGSKKVDLHEKNLPGLKFRFMIILIFICDP
jgi:hypothetical protein